MKLHRLLRLVQCQGEQVDFFHQHGLLPEMVECGKYQDNLSLNVSGGDGS